MTFRVVEIDDAPENMVRLGGKVKFLRGEVLGSYASVAEAVEAQGLQQSPGVSGFLGTSTSGDGGTSTSGTRGRIESGYLGKAKGGKDSILILTGKNSHEYRPYCAVVGHTKGVEPDVFYKLNDKNRFVKFEEETKNA